MDDNLKETQLQLISPAFRDGFPIPMQYTCKGPNINPPLNILGVDKNTKSLTLIMHDPDSVHGDYTHWLIWDIPRSCETITANSVPSGAVQGYNDAGSHKYVGPCPPAGTGIHHYKFELYALDVPLSLEENTTRQQLEAAIGGHILDRHTLTGLFSGD